MHRYSRRNKDCNPSTFNGCDLASWNLVKATQKAMVVAWNSRNNSKHKLGNSVMTLSTMSVRAQNADFKHCGPTYFIAKATVLLNSEGETRICNRFVIPNDAFGASKGLLHKGTVCGSFFQTQADGTESNDVFSFAYTTVSQAKTSLLWYLFWNNCSPGIWVPEYFPANLWSSVKSSDRHHQSVTGWDGWCGCFGIRKSYTKLGKIYLPQFSKLLALIRCLCSHGLCSCRFDFVWTPFEVTRSL